MKREKRKKGAQVKKTQRHNCSKPSGLFPSHRIASRRSVHLLRDVYEGLGEGGICTVGKERLTGYECRELGARQGGKDRKKEKKTGKERERGLLVRIPGPQYSTDTRMTRTVRAI